MTELTDEQCNEFRRHPGSFNDMVRHIYKTAILDERSRCKFVVRNESELEDAMPDQMFEYMSRGRHEMAESMRAAVRATKIGILSRIEAP